MFLNADHTHSLAKAIVAAKAGFDAIRFDGSQLPFDENVKQTKQAVEAIKTINPSIIVEGEIGDIGSGSEIHETIPEMSKILTTPEQAKQFVDATGIDVLAPAVGNMHGLLPGMIRGEMKKRLHVQRIRDIKKATGIFMTLHGGSGTDDEDFKSAVKAGITIVHVSTEMRLAWRQGLEAALAKSPDELVPYKILREALGAVKKVAHARLQLFNQA
jgi:fructose-bisphosphate aldolase class II